jgi:Tfp pilus assembly protein PilX
MSSAPPVRLCGLAVLPVISLLLIGLSVLALLSSRTQWAELRSSTAMIRARTAFEAAEAGLIHAAVALSEPSTSATLATCSASAPPRCVAEAAPATGWVCQCGLDTALPEPTFQTHDTDRPAFATRIERRAQPGQVEIISTGCSSVARGCGGQRPADASATVRAIFATVGIPLTLPGATLSAQGNVRLRNSARVIHDRADPASLTVDAGQAISIDPLSATQGAPGTPPESTRVEFDPAWAGTRFDDHILRQFGMSATRLARLPQWQKPSCAPTCSVADLGTSAGAAAERSRMFWIDGDLHLSTLAASQLGTDEHPILLVVSGRLTLGGPITLVGWIMAGQGLHWQSSLAGSLRGAAQALGEVSIDGPLTLDFDLATLQILQTDAGTRALVPGSWRDHTP